MSPLWILWELRMTEVVVTNTVIRLAKLQSNRQQTNTQLFTGRMPFLSPNQHCQSTEERVSKTPSTLGRLQTLKAAGYPAGRVAKPLVSPLMPAANQSISTL